MDIQFYRNTHFLGSKIKHLRTLNNMTLEELSVRCYQINDKSSPSISYLSLIENGKRSPSQELMLSIRTIFQKEEQWFYDKNILVTSDKDIIKGQFETIDLQPNFLFSKEILEKTIPSLLSQTGTTGRQFAHILIRAYQEKNKNQFPYIEKEADAIGKKLFPLEINDIMNLYKKHNLKIKWFEKKSFITKDDSGKEIKTLFRSFYHSPNCVYVNSKMKDEIYRLKYDLAAYLAHYIMHNGDGIVSTHASGGEVGGSPRPFEKKSSSFDQKDILYAWRDFECSFFAGALLCPKIPFRRFLNRNNYNIYGYNKLKISPSVYMRRLTAVSSYKHWHYFDVYPPGYLRAMYRGNGIPMPWGNMRLVTDPCRQWGVFKLLSNLQIKKPFPQLSLLKENNIIKLYCSLSLKTNDAAGNPHIICTGIELNEALDTQGYDTDKIINFIYENASKKGGTILPDKKIRSILFKVGTVLNISWIIEALNYPIDIICQRSTNCPRDKKCENITKTRTKISWVSQIKEDILAKN